MSMARRCSGCDVNWPTYGERFKTCPLCNEPTWDIKDTQPVDYNEADRLIAEHRKAADEQRAKEAEYQKKLAEFERRYAEREVAKLWEEMDDWAAHFAKLGSLPTK